MKRFKKKSFWVLYVTIVLAGAFIFVALGLQSQSPRIPNVNAQGFNRGIGTTTTGFSFAGDIIFAGASFPGDIIKRWLRNENHNDLQRVYSNHVNM